MKRFTSTTVAGLLALTMSVTAIGFAGGKEAKTTAKDGKAACCAMDAKACTEKDAASCPMMKSKGSTDAKPAKATKASLKTKKATPAPSAATGGTN